MENAEYFKDYRDYVAFQSDRYDKATLFENEQILVGLIWCGGRGNPLGSGAELRPDGRTLGSLGCAALDGQAAAWMQGQIAVQESTRERFPHVDELLTDWPSEALEKLRPDEEIRIIDSVVDNALLIGDIYGHLSQLFPKPSTSR